MIKLTVRDHTNNKTRGMKAIGLVIYNMVRAQKNGPTARGIRAAMPTEKNMDMESFSGLMTQLMMGNGK